MSVLGFLLLLVIGAICGAVAEIVVGYSPGGFLTSVVVGFVGAWIGDRLAGPLHLPSLLVVRIEGHTLEIVWTVLGSILLLVAVSLLRRTSSYRRRHA
jgi:uncharacterized membrane protein YeaQ/YmgE (transglycosylase-associated protein family)